MTGSEQQLQQPQHQKAVSPPSDHMFAENEDRIKKSQESLHKIMGELQEEEKHFQNLENFKKGNLHDEVMALNNKELTEALVDGYVELRKARYLFTLFDML